MATALNKPNKDHGDDRPAAIHRRTASLALVRSCVHDATNVVVDPSDQYGTAAGRNIIDRRGHSFRRFSLSSWRHSGGDIPTVTDDHQPDRINNLFFDHHLPKDDKDSGEAAGGGVGEKKAKKKPAGIWRSWKPVQALARIGMRRLACLFSVEIISVNDLTPSMDGLRLAVTVRKEETKAGAVNTVPSRVQHGFAEFDETLFVRCNLYCSGGGGTGKPLKLDARRFVISVIPVEAPEMSLGQSTVDLSELVLESVQRSSEGQRLRHWERAFKLSGKAAGGELLVRLGFQLMEGDKGLAIYNNVVHQANGVKTTTTTKELYSSPATSVAREQSKSSFSVSSQRYANPKIPAIDLDGELYGDESTHRAFEVIDKGVEVSQQTATGSAVGSTDLFDDATSRSPTPTPTQTPPPPPPPRAPPRHEIVKHVAPFHGDHREVLVELDLIAEQIKALEYLMNGGETAQTTGRGGLLQQHQLDSDEETVTRDTLRMLEAKGRKGYGSGAQSPITPRTADLIGKVLPDLADGIGPVVQTEDGGFLASINPFNGDVMQQEPPILAMQISRPFILQSPHIMTNGFEVFQRLAAMPAGELRSHFVSWANMDDLTGKTAAKIAFEGVAAAVVSGRAKEGASSSAARSIQVSRKMAAAMAQGRKERRRTGIWSAGGGVVTVEDMLPSTVQRLEAMALEALKIQADMADEEAAFEVPPVIDTNDDGAAIRVIDSIVPLESWVAAKRRRSSSSSSGGAGNSDNVITMLVVVQLRDPSRGYEAVGSAMVGVIQAVKLVQDEQEDDQLVQGGGVYKLTNVNMGGLQLRSEKAMRSSSWGGERERLTAMQWLVGHGYNNNNNGKPAAKAGLPAVAASAGKLVMKKKDCVWSISTRVLANMWLKTIRNPDVRVSGSS